MESQIDGMVDTINELEAENAALKAKVEKFTSYNKRSMQFGALNASAGVRHWHPYLIGTVSA